MHRASDTATFTTPWPITEVENPQKADGDADGEYQYSEAFLQDLLLFFMLFFIAISIYQKFSEAVQ